MNLVIDIGNTRCKLGVFKQNKLAARYSIDSLDLEKTLKDLQKRWSFNGAISSSTSNFKVQSIKKALPEVNFLQLSKDTSVPFTNDYLTPTTLGLDRIALVAAAALKYPKQNVLVIDIGTCITYDFLNKENHFKGGAISPGIVMRYKAMNAYTAKLPYLEATKAVKLIGDSTESAMHSGVINGVCAEIDGIISEYLSRFDTLTVILTGGDSEFLAKRIKNSIFANSNFLLEGLNYILEFNTDA